MAAKKILISVRSSQKREPPALRQVRHHLKALGLQGLACKGLSAVYALEGAVTAAEVKKIAEEILCDPVVEAYGVDERPAGNGTYFSDVWYKPGVTDAVGDSLLKAIRDLKIFSVEKAFSGQRYEFSAGGGNPHKKILEFTGKELLNPLVQECKIQ